MLKKKTKANVNQSISNEKKKSDHYRSQHKGNIFVHRVIIQMRSLLCLKPWTSQIKVCLFSMTYRSLYLWFIFTWLHLSDYISYDLPSFSLPATLEFFALGVPSAWKSLSQITSFMSSWKVSHNDTVPGYAGQNFGLLS